MESPGVAGLGVLDAVVRRLPPTVCVPQLGWNSVATAASGGMVEGGHAYFANSYYIDAVSGSWTPSFAEHGVRMVAAVERDAQLACQFHPELSGRWGAALLERWWARC